MQQKILCRNFCCKVMETNSGLRAYLNISFVQGMGRNQKELIRNWPRNFRFFYQQNSSDKAIIDDRAQKTPEIPCGQGILTNLRGIYKE